MARENLTISSLLAPQGSLQNPSIPQSPSRLLGSEENNSIWGELLFT